jgi:hypothetical protein
MPASVSVNSLTVVHKTSNGVSMIFPDVCKTPAPPAPSPIPIPYPNIAMSKDTAAGSSTVQMDGNPIMIKSSYYAMSTGDEAGVALGVVSSKIKGKAYPKLYSFDVKADGESVFRLSDIMLQNGGSPTNTPPGTNVQPPQPPAVPQPAKDPEIPEVVKMKWAKDKVACGDLVKLEVETKNFTAATLSVSVLRGNATKDRQAFFSVPISGNKGSFEWKCERMRYEKEVKVKGEQTSFKGTKDSDQLLIKTAPDAKEAIHRQASTPKYVKQVVGGVNTWVKTATNYGWDVAYDIEIKSGQFSVTRKIDFKLIDGASASDKDKRDWKNQIERVWNNKFKIHRVDCKRGDTCGCNADQGCCAYAIHIYCVWAAGQGKQVELRPGANDPKGWGAKHKWWYSHEWWERLANVPSTVRAHEFGHQIGMWDEYAAGACDPARKYTNEPTSIMGSGSQVYERHLQEFHDWFKAKAGGELGDTKLLRR